MRLWENRPHDHRLSHQPHAVQHVVLPPDAIQRNGIHIGVEEVAQTADELLEGEALRALREGEELYDVGVGEGVEADVEEAGIAR